MSVPNPFISSGTCYNDKEIEAHIDVLPCGNAALGNKHCCWVGDMCLEDKYCRRSGSNMTYTVACTDPTFEDAEKCNDPGMIDQWMRVKFCVAAESPDDEGPRHTLVAYCGQSQIPSDPDDDSCVCSHMRGFEYTVDNSLYDPVVLLPSSLGESVIWQEGYEPTSSGQSIQTVPGATVTVEASGDEPNDNDEGRGGLGAGAKAGIGVGVSLACLLALGIMFLLWRRRKKGSGAADGTEKGAPPGNMTELPVRPGTPPPGELEADTSWLGVGSGVEKRKTAEAVDEAVGLKHGEAGYDRTIKAVSVASELP